MMPIHILICMNLMPLPAARVISINKERGKMYGPDTLFRVGTDQPSFLNCAGMLFTWTGQIDRYGYYLYKSFAKYKCLIFR